MTVINGIQLDKDRVLSFTYNMEILLRGFEISMRAKDRMSDKYQQLVAGLK